MNQPIRVLFIEDSPDDMKLILNELKKGGYKPLYRRVQTAETLTEALHNEKWQLILCDYSMPEFDGLNALRIVKRQGLDIPFILLSRSVKDDIAVKTMTEGAHDFLRKGNLNRLIPAIERELRETEIREMHRLSEIEIKKSEKRLRKAQQIAKIGNWEYDYLSNTLDCSEEIFKILEIDSIDFELNSSSFLDLIHPDHREIFAENYRLSKANKGFFEFTFKLNPKRNNIKYIRAQAEHVYNENGDLVQSVGILQDVTKSVLSQIKIKESLHEKKLLLAEIHHRVKNNMAIISSLLQLGLNDDENERTKNLILGSVLRIKTMTLIHDKLYSCSDFAKISINSFVFDLITIIKNHFTAKKDISLITNIDEAILNINQAIPLALILNELITNAFKHAFLNSENGEIEINIHVNRNHLLLDVSDNGSGFPEDFDFTSTQSLGLTMVNLLVEQLEGILVLDHKNGSHFSFEFEIKQELKGAGGNFFPPLNGAATYDYLEEFEYV